MILGKTVSPPAIVMIVVDLKGNGKWGGGGSDNVTLPATWNLNLASPASFAPLLVFMESLLMPFPLPGIYARIDVFCNLHKRKHQKSKPKTLASVTVFNETFLFHLPEPIVWDCAVLVSVYELEPKGRQLVGQAALGKRGPDGSDDHWDSMMQSIQQPVAKWHPLLI